jgi:squalene-associated FAD-dependent desaturase
MSGERVVILGGGVAGITAALDCAEAGARVTLLEVRRRLGGAAYSFERDGMVLDNGQHVFMRCCTAYRGLLARLGSERHVELQPRLHVPVLSPGRRPTSVSRTRLPAPLHLSWSLARYGRLTPLERLRVARGAWALARADVSGEAVGAPTLGSFLEDHGQGPRALANLWDLIALPTLNVPVSEASLELGAFVFKTALLTSASAGDIGFHVGTLAQVICEPALEALERAGVDVRLGWRAERIAREGGGFVVAGAGAPDALDADAVIVAVGHTRAASLIEPLLPHSARALRGLESSPIVNLHVVYDRHVCDERFAAGIDTPIQYVFDRGEAAGAPAGAQYLAVSLSGARAEMGMAAEELRSRYEAALAELFPRAREARVLRFLTTREHAATFRAVPGIGTLRPSSHTSVRGLALAGAYTDTGWPATLEGAARSGHAAAKAVLTTLELGHAQSVEQPESMVAGAGAGT